MSGSTKMPRAEIPAYIREAITAAGYDISRVADVVYIEDVKTMWAGEDYDPYFEHSQPGDYRDVPQPARIEFGYWKGRTWTPETIFFHADTPTNGGSANE